MPASSAPDGFILIKDACERFNRSHRQLNRDRVKAMNRGDETVTAHFKLQVEDGGIFEGGELSVDEVSRLRDDGKNPVWYVEENWMEETFGLKGQRPTKETPSPQTAATEPTKPSAKEPVQSSQSTRPSAEAEILREQLHREREQNALLVEQLKIKDDQIKSGFDLARENQELTKQLHLLLANLQQTLTAGSMLLPMQTDSARRRHNLKDASATDAADVTTQHPIKNKTEKGSQRKATPTSSPKKARRNHPSKETNKLKRPAKKTLTSSSKTVKKILASDVSMRPVTRFVSRFFTRGRK